MGWPAHRRAQKDGEPGLEALQAAVMPKAMLGDGEASWLMPGRDTMASTTASTQWTPRIDPQGLALCCRQK